MRRLMAFADSAGWRVASAEGAKAVIVAYATTGQCDDTSTDSREFTLHIDVTEPPISTVTVSERVNTSTMPEWGMVASADDVATMAWATGGGRARRPGTTALGVDESDICPRAADA